MTCHISNEARLLCYSEPLECQCLTEPIRAQAFKEAAAIVRGLPILRTDQINGVLEAAARAIERLDAVQQND